MSINKIKEFFMSSWAIDNRVTTYVLTIIVTLLGIWSFNSLPKENFPEIAVPMIYIGTPYPGNSAENIEENLTYHIEKELKSIKGVKKIKSQSIQDFSVIIVEFETKIDIKEAKDEVSAAVDKAKQKLPQDLPGDPLVQDINLSEIPIMFINISSDLAENILKKYAEDLQDKIEQLPEIRRVDLLGIQDKEVQVNLDLIEMHAKGIAFGDVENAIRQRDVLISGGNVGVGSKEYNWQISGNLSTVEEIKEITVRNNKGSSLKIRDIADVKMAYKKRESYARLDGKPTVNLSIIKKAGENLVTASEKINELIDEFMKNDIPEEYRKNFNIKISADQSFMTKNMLNELMNTIIIGFILVTMVLMFFMGIRDSVFVGLSVPLSSLIAFVVLPWLGFTLNLVVLFTFIFALGIVVDNAIVVIENTHRLLNKEGMGIVQAAKFAAGEVITPVFAGTLTTMAPFLPLAFWEGIIGEFMFFLPITIIITLFGSLLVAYVINPVFAVTFMRREDENKKLSLKLFLIILVSVAVMAGVFHAAGATIPGNIMILIGLTIALFRFVIGPLIKWFQDRALPWMMDIYRKVLRWSLKPWRPLIVLGATFGMFIVSLMIFGASSPKVVFFPDADPNFIYVYTKLPNGTDIDKTNIVTEKIEKIIYDVIGENNPAVKSIITNVAKGAGNPRDFNTSSIYPNKSRIQVEFVPYKERNGVSTKDYLAEIRKRVKDISGASITVEKEANGPATAKPINIEIKGDDFWKMKDVAQQLKGYLDSLIRTNNIVGVEELLWDIELGKPNLEMDINFTKAGELGMNAAQIGMAVRTAVFGKEVSQFRVGEDEYPIMVRLDEKYRGDVEAIGDMIISYRDMSTGLFHNVPIRSVATIRDTSTFSGINRLDLKKVVTISSNVLSDYNANEVVYNVIDWVEEWKVKNAKILNGVSIESTGELKEQEETSAFLGRAMISSMILIFLILVFQFNSLPKVLIIFTQIVFSIIGVLLGFGISGMDIAIVMFGVGIVSLAGIVVNNGIILLDFIEIMRGRGYKTRDAIVEGGATRFIPVMLTASSTVLGLLPLAFAMNINFGTLFSELNPHIFFGGDTAVFWGPLSWTVIFGLSFATLVTLVVVPVLFYSSYLSGIWFTRNFRAFKKYIAGFID